MTCDGCCCGCLSEDGPLIFDGSELCFLFSSCSLSFLFTFASARLLCHFSLLFSDLVCFVLHISLACLVPSPTFCFFTFSFAFSLPAVTSVPFPLFCFLSPSSHTLYFLFVCSSSICLPFLHVSVLFLPSTTSLHFPPYY